MTQELLERKNDTKEKMKDDKKVILKKGLGMLNRYKLVLIIPCVVAGCAYLGGVLYFQNHFYYGTHLNNVDISGLTVDDAFMKINDESGNYDIIIKGRNGIHDYVQGSDINFRLSEKTKSTIREIKEKQNSFNWCFNMFNENDYIENNMYAFDEEDLSKEFKDFNLVNNKNIVKPQEPHIEYKNNNFCIVSEVEGNVINKDNLYKTLKQEILNGERNMDITDSDCYNNPKYTSESKEVLNSQKNVNSYKNLKITYLIDNKKITVDGSTICSFLKVNDNFEESVDKKKIKEYVDKLSEKYNSAGKPRKFKTTAGSIITISGGDYGNTIDEDAEVEAIVNMLKNKKSEERKPLYLERKFIKSGNEIGDTYVEVNLSGQHLWFYKKGKLITEGDIVSGNMSAGHGTPGGIYRLKFKQKNAILKGENYATPVSYWMPFNGGIGIHDANWRSSFGGSIYIGGGSHGCVNAPYMLAQTIFNNIDTDTPVVCYY